MKITIQRIAELAGVSKTTVSLVVNGKARQTRISPVTEKRVLDLVRELDYSPNKMARNFRLHKTDTIGFILPDLKNPFFSRLSHSMERLAREKGYQLLIGCSNDRPETEIDLTHHFVSSAIEGLLVASAMNTDELVRRIYTTNIPAVFIDRTVMTERISSVSSDNFKGAYDVVNHLCSLGVGEVDYIGGDPDISTSRRRFLGYQKALEDNHVSADKSRVFHGDYQSTSGYLFVKQLFLDRNRLPEAFFTGSYTLLEGALQAIREIHGFIPQDLKIATFDDHPLLDYLPNRVLSVRQDYDALACASIEMLLRAINGDRRIEHQRIEPELIIR